MNTLKKIYITYHCFNCRNNWESSINKTYSNCPKCRGIKISRTINIEKIDMDDLNEEFLKTVEDLNENFKN